MEAKNQIIIDLIGKKDNSFSIPRYQRKYSWTNKNIDILWKDLKEFNKNKNTSNYFLGAIIIKRLNNIQNEFILVDGQQRITTLLIMFASLLYSLDKDEDEKLYYKVFQALETDSNNNKFKLKRIDDQHIIEKILKGKDLNQIEKKTRYYEVYTKFNEKFKNMNNIEKDEFWSSTIDKIEVAMINLNTDEDEFLVFESINSKGKELSSADLIKNYIIMKLESNNKDKEIEIFENKFLNIFNSFPKPDDSLMNFYRQIYAIKFKKLLSKSNKQLYYAIKEDINKSKNIEKIIKDYYDDAIIFQYIIEEKYNYPFWSYPLLKANKMNFYAIIHLIFKYNSRIESDSIVIENKKNIENSLKFLSKLVVARSLYNFGEIEGNRSYANIAAKLNSEIESSGNFKESFQKEVINFLEESSWRDRMPSWEDISNINDKRDLYTNHRNSLKWILIAIENSIADNESLLANKKISIEHIYPQNPKKNLIFIDEEVLNKNDNIGEWIHTLGNLSITTFNQSLSNNDFDEKKEINEKRSYLKINKELLDYKKFGIEEIKKRAKDLLNKIEVIWFN